ncbi:MAG: Uma2 family endonuclease [Planctomycetia bacterium]|nr:Uma2 family endonuclease [Planctomycetia bacterium]
MATEVIAGPSPEELFGDVELVAEDGIPLESTWHLFNIHLLVDSAAWRFQGRDDYYAGGNQFIYFSKKQARDRDFRGPDFYLVLGTRKEPLRDYWCVWEEDGKYPNLIIELLSPSTADLDRTVKKNVYEKVFRTPNYYCYDPATQTLDGWELIQEVYRPLIPNEQGRLWCPQMNAWLGTWQGIYQDQDAVWLRFFDANGQILLIDAEASRREAEVARQQVQAAQQQAEAAQQQAEAAQQQAEMERHRAEQAEAELARLKALLAEREAQQKPQ